MTSLSSASPVLQKEENDDDDGQYESMRRLRLFGSIRVLWFIPPKIHWSSFRGGSDEWVDLL